MTDSRITLQLILAAHIWIQPPIPVDDRPYQHKISRCTPYMLPDTIYVASENYVSTFTKPSDSPRLFLLPSDDPNPPHAMKKDDPYRGRVKIGYCCRKHTMQKYATKRWGSIGPCDMIRTGNFINVMGFSRIISEMRICLTEHQHCTEQRFSWLLYFSPFYHLLYPLNSFLCLFSSCYIDHSPRNNTYFCFDWNVDLALFLLDCFECVRWHPYQISKLYQPSSSL